MDKLSPPEALNLDGNIAENWRRWKQRFEIFSLASGLSEKDAGIQAAAFLHVAGSEALEVYNTFSWPTADDKNKVDKIMEKFDQYCNPRKNVTWERHKFNTRNQQPGETIDQYVTDLKTKAQTCEFAELKDGLIRDRIICGIICDRTRARLLKEGELTLQKALDICRANEATTTQLKTLSSSATSKETHYQEVLAIQKRYQSDNPKPQCDKCGNRHYRHQPCPAQGVECYNCGRRNHFAKVCRSRTNTKYQKKIHSVTHDGSDTSDDLFIGMVKCATTKLPDWKVTLLINNHRMCFKIDTGAQCNVISRQKYHQLSSMPLQQSHARLVAFGGQRLNACGKVTMNCQHKGKRHPVVFEVIDHDTPNILGLKTCVELNLVQRMDAIDNHHVDILDRYSDVFEGLGCITDASYHIKVDESAQPVVHPPRKVPVTLRPKIQQELRRMEKLDVIEKVEEPTDWVNSMVTIVKPNGSLRICIDPRDLNMAVKRDYYPMSTIDEIVTRMPNAKVFSVLDASSGFWQLKLDTPSAKLCTFNTPFGRYMFKRLPFGLSSSQDIFQRIMSEMFHDIKGVEVVVDDLLIWGESKEQHDARLTQVLERARHRNLKLNKTKCQIRKDAITYIGHILSKDGLKPDPKKTEAITNMPCPQNRDELQRFLGMLTYQGKFIPNLSHVASPLRTLLEKNVEWHWQPEQEKSFLSLKELITTAPVLKYFDPSKHIKLSVDASSKGLGAVLLQENHPVAYASRALTTCQQNCAQIEKEMLAVAFGCTRFHEYIYGMPTIEVETDHKPLEAIFKKPLHQAPARLQKMIMSIQKYQINLVYRPGKQLVIADTLSRAYLPEYPDNSMSFKFEVNVISVLPISNSKLEQLQSMTQSDSALQQLMQLTLDGWPDHKSKVPTHCLPYWSFRDQISFSDGILFKGEKIIIPKAMQPEMLKLIHSSHLGMEKCKRRARDILYWPGMSSQIQNVVSSCAICNMYQRKNQKEPLIPHPIPDRPWSKVGVDIFELQQKQYLVIVDYYSGFVELDLLTHTTTKQVINCCKSQFSRHGIPDILISDNGPQFSSHEFRQFIKHYQIDHHTSSPYHPQSNGMAEKAVQTSKRMMKKAAHDGNDPYLALLEYRNTPWSDTLGSPAQRLMGRRTKTLIPTSSSLLKPETISPITVQEELQKHRRQQKLFYDQHAKPLNSLSVGDSVLMTSKDGRWRPAKVTSISQTAPRSYNIVTPQGQNYRRNRKDLRKVTGGSTDIKTNVDEFLDDQSYDSDTNEPVEENSNARESTSPVVSAPAVRRSQRTIRAPIRYADQLS